MTKPTVLDRICNLVFFIPVGTLYAWALSQSLLAATILDIPSRQMFLFCAIFVTAINLILFNKYTILGFFSILLLGGGWVFISLYRQDFEASWFLYLKDTLEAFAFFARSQLPYRDEFSQIASLGIAFLFSFATAFNTKFDYGFLPLTVLAAGTIMVPIYMEWGKSDAAIFVMLFCLLVMLGRKLYMGALRSAEEGAALSSPSLYALFLLPLCLLAFGTGWALPKPDTRTVDDMSLPDVAGAVNNILYALSPEQLVSFTENNRRLGGPANLNNRVVMIIDAEESLYLTGVVRDHYTGDAWQSLNQSQSNLKADNSGVFSTDENPESLRRSQAYFRNFYAWPVREMTITTSDVRTRMMFSPPFKQTLKMEERIPVTQDSYGCLSGTKVLSKESSYSQSYISWDYQSPYFAYILSNFAAQRGASGFTGAQLAPFLQLPDSLPARVADLAREITAEAYTPYEKLKALENYLAAFPYNLNAEPLPEDEDFVDYFLFTAREGYCVHYASSMTVMARSIGIPARYVEGFIMPEFRAVDGRYWVTNEQAHAWTEAYFEGFGWVRFEPTSPYNAILNGRDPSPEEDPAPTLDDETESVYDDQPSQPEESIPPPVLPDPDPEQHENETEKSGFPWSVTISILVLGGLGLIIYREITARYRFKRDLLNALPNREAVLALFASMLNAAEACGCPISPNETALAYAERTASDPIYAGPGVDIKRLADIYSRAAYSFHEVTGRERSDVLDARNVVLLHLKASRKKLPRYCFDHYILLRY